MNASLTLLEALLLLMRMGALTACIIEAEVYGHEVEYQSNIAESQYSN
jgi:hypothetical protein